MTSVARSGRTRAREASLGLALALGVASSHAAAADALPDGNHTFSYRTPMRKQYLRTVVEELGLIGAGLGYYYIKQQENEIDWALNYDWLSFRQKLTCAACTFDQNFFDTNFVTHPLAGTLYYIAARGNRLGVLESFGTAFTMSTLWEFLGEFRERVSINDMIVTPLSGLAIGEATTQLGAFFDRGCDTPANRFFGSLFAPSKAIHDAIDGAVLERARMCDERGLTTDGAHAFRYWAGAAAVWPSGHAPPIDEYRFGLDMAVAHLDELARPGEGWVGFSDGNVASIDTRVALDSVYVSDFRIGAHVLPAGLYYRNLRVAGAKVAGHEVTVGLLVGAEYSLHREVRPAGPWDRLFVVDTPSARLVYALRRPAFTLEASLDGGGTFAGVTSLALPEYRLSHDDAALSAVTRLQGYSHTFGLALGPRVRLRFEGAELGVVARADRFFAVRVLDPTRPAHGTAPIYESRRRGEAWLSVGPPDGIARATFFVESYYRASTVAEAQASQHELACGGRLEAAF